MLKYIENALAHPDDEKYRKIRRTNQVFVDKVAIVPGAEDVLRAAGFTETQDVLAEGAAPTPILLLPEGFSTELLTKAKILLCKEPEFNRDVHVSETRLKYLIFFFFPAFLLIRFLRRHRLL